MIKKLLEIIRENKRNQKEIIRYSRELNWANVYHDSIRGKDWLENLSLNVGRWGCNYAFLYIVNRILSDFAPRSILELGLGESTKFISAFIEKKIPHCQHLVLEQDKEWKDFYLKNYNIPHKTEIRICEIEQRIITGYETLGFQGFNEIVREKKFDLYIVDGPIGTKHLSRYDLVYIAQNFEAGDEFVIIADDYERIGERETVQLMMNIFEKKGIKVHKIGYHGLKQVLVIATPKYKYLGTF